METKNEDKNLCDKSREFMTLSLKAANGCPKKADVIFKAVSVFMETVLPVLEDEEKKKIIKTQVLFIHAKIEGPETSEEIQLTKTLKNSDDTYLKK